MNGPIHVAVDMDGTPRQAGVLRLSGGRLPTSAFQYDRAYTGRTDAYQLDPALPLEAGTRYAPGLPGAISDAAPDRWGRNLIRKRLLRSGELGARRPGELDFLLGVSDETRQGALRFSRESGGPYLAEHADVPKTVALPRLLRAAERVATDDDSDAEVKLLLDAGTGSLGGARPKASVRDDDHLLIAKFPHPGDSWDVMAWEATALDLAARSGIDIPEHHLVQVGGKHVLLVRRFDRNGTRRIGYLSAMSLVGAHDGDAVDYLEVAEHLAVVGSSTTADLRQLWRRQLFGALINNTDDHARNHGLLRTPTGWRLAPAFDINPNPEPGEHQMTTLGESRSSRLIEVLLGCVSEFGLRDAEARQIMDEVRSGVRPWRSAAARNGIRATECDYMASAFAAV